MGGSKAVRKFEPIIQNDRQVYRVVITTVDAWLALRRKVIVEDDVLTSGVASSFRCDKRQAGSVHRTGLRRCLAHPRPPRLRFSTLFLE
jgi:hypothetical protein